MSALRAIQLPTQRLEALPAAETEAYGPLRPRQPEVPRWALLVEETIRVTARLGFSPTPTILVVFTIVLTLSLDRG